MGRLTEAIAIINKEKFPDRNWINANITFLNLDDKLSDSIKKIRRRNKK